MDKEKSKKGLLQPFSKLKALAKSGEKCSNSCNSRVGLSCCHGVHSIDGDHRENLEEGKQQKQFSTIDDILDNEVGSCGLFHLFIGLYVICIQGSFATGVYASVFTDYTPNYHCNINNSTLFDFDTSIFEDNLTCMDDMGEKCQSWVYDTSVVQTSASQEFDIVCDKGALKSWSGILRMSGVLVGSFFFGWLSDNYGRVTSMALACTILSTAQILLAFSWSYLAFTLLNIVSAGSGIGCFIVGFVYLFEWISSDYRTKVSVMAQTPFALGYMYLVLIAYFIRNWRNLQLVIAVVNLFLISSKFLLPETARWLSSRGRDTDAMKSLRFAARVNQKRLPENLEILEGKEQDQEDKDISMWTLVKRGFLLKRLVILSWNWIVITMCFYGLSLSSARDERMYENMAAMAAVEIPGYVISALVVECWGRRPILSFFQVLGGASCICAGFVPLDYPTVKLGLALIGKMGVSAGFAVVYVYTAELFPTKVRNTAIGVCSTMARFGGIVAPVLGDLESIYLPLPLLLMGGCSVVAGGVAALLPETQGRKLPQTIQDAKMKS